ncbi:MAG: SGNH/GDSL hydrolase family protein [Clostridia bacterium]|nr:SGNH/GDSL hydrolase family protein [Clostridia bacterium]
MKDITEKYIHARGALPHFAAAIERGRITVGFVGGSITEPENGKRWSDKVIDWLAFNFPGLDITVENAAKGATGSLSAVFRVDEDILTCGCDIVFVETAVNDGPSAWGDCREGLLRKLLKADSFDVALVYTYCQGMYDAMLKRELPESVADWERLAEHYGLCSVHCGQYAFDLTAAGFLRWEEWLPDGLHPEFAGSRVYAEAAAHLLEGSLDDGAKEPSPALPAPLYPNNWEKAYSLPFDEVSRHGPWRVTRIF